MLKRFSALGRFIESQSKYTIEESGKQLNIGNY
jgi:hypothetical protein